MKYLTVLVHYEFKIAMCQESTRRAPPPDQWVGFRGEGGGGGEWLGAGKEIWSTLRADVSKYRPEVYKSEKSKILKKFTK